VNWSKNKFFPKPMKKFVPLNKLKKKIEKLRKKGKRIVLTNGCFDIVHSGHVRCLEKAKSLGDILVVALNSDQSVRRLKGKNRPVFPLKERTRFLNAFECVDFLTSFSSLTPIEVIKNLKPDILIKGADYQDKEIVGSEFVKSYGGKVKRFPIYKEFSSSKIIKKFPRLF